MKKNLYKLLQTMLVMSIVFTTFVLNRQSEVQAESLQGVIDSLIIDKKDGESFFTGKSVKIKGTWSIPDDTIDKIYEPGDTFAIEIPQELRTERTSFPLKDNNGKILANGEMIDGKLVFTFTENIHQLKNRQGGFVLTFQLDVEQTDEKQDVDLVFKDDYGQVISKDTITVQEKSEEIGEMKENFSKGNYELDGTDTVKWFIRINAQGKYKEDEVITVTDRLSGNHILLEDKIEIHYAPHGETVSEKMSEDMIEQYLTINLDKDQKGFKISFKENNLYWYTIIYQTQYNGEEYNSIVELENSAYAEGSSSGVIPTTDNKNQSDNKVQLDFRGWASGNQVYGNFRIHKIDSKSKERLAGAEFAMKHAVYDDISMSATTDENGVAIFNNLIDGEYTLTEVKAPEGYEKMEARKVFIKYDDNKEMIYEVENTLKPIEIEVEKQWFNAKNEVTEAKEDVIFDLLADGEAVRRAILPKGQKTVRFVNLPKKNQNGQDIKYTLQEKTEHNYHVDITEKEDGFVVKNTVDVGQMDITVNKEWLTSDNKPMPSKEDIEIILHAFVEGQEIKTYSQVLKKGESKIEFKDLPKTDIEGKLIEYKVEEKAVPGYETSITAHENGHEYTVINKVKVNSIRIEVEKQWYNANSEKMDSKEDIIIELYADGKRVQEKKLNKGEKVIVFENLPEVHEDGAQINYEVKEKELEHYTTDVIKEGHKVTIKNTYVQDYMDITGEKIWKRLSGKEIVSHAPIQIILKANEEEVQKIQLPQGESSFVFKDLPTADIEGNPLDYTIEEVSVKGFTSSVNFDKEKNHVEIVNTKEIEYTDIKGEKIWFDASGNMLDESEQTDITIELLKDGEVSDTVTLEKGQYEFSFTNLPKTDDKGVPYTYSIREVDIEGFHSFVSFEEEANKYVVSNKKDTEYFNLEGNKIWLGLDGQEMDPQAEITVDLYANDERVDTRVLSKEETSFTFENLPRTDEKGLEIAYRVSERELEGFTSMVEMKQDHVTITNTQDVEYFNLEGNKVWLGLDGKAMDSKETITIELYANGSLVSKQILEKGDYDFVFSDLPKTDEKGERIHYTISEVEVEGYESSITYDEEAGAYLIVNKEIEPEVPSKPEEPKPEEVEEISVEPGVIEPEEVEEVESAQIEPEEVEEVLAANVLPQTGQGVSSIVYVGFTGILLGLYLILSNRKKDE